MKLLIVVAILLVMGQFAVAVAPRGGYGGYVEYANSPLTKRERYLKNMAERIVDLQKRSAELRNNVEKDSVF